MTPQDQLVQRSETYPPKTGQRCHGLHGMTAMWSIKKTMGILAMGIQKIHDWLINSPRTLASYPKIWPHLKVLYISVMDHSPIIVLPNHIRAVMKTLCRPFFDLRQRRITSWKHAGMWPPSHLKQTSEMAHRAQRLLHRFDAGESPSAKLSVNLSEFRRARSQLQTSLPRSKRRAPR